jgi:ubiquinone biosynthesis accessory factor UbiJ
MFKALHALLGNAAIERITLLINHVLASESVATRRLLPHADRFICLHFHGWPSILPPLPVMAFRITAAGLLEWCGAASEVEVPIEMSLDADLSLTIDVANPALTLVQALAGTRPKVDVAGDSTLAADLNWLFDNLRWDVQDDLAKIIGPMPAREVARLASAVAGAVRLTVGGLGALSAHRAANSSRS